MEINEIIWLQNRLSDFLFIISRFKDFSSCEGTYLLILFYTLIDLLFDMSYGQYAPQMIIRTDEQKGERTHVTTISFGIRDEG